MKVTEARRLILRAMDNIPYASTYRGRKCLRALDGALDLLSVRKRPAIPCASAKGNRWASERSSAVPLHAMITSSWTRDDQ
jgi:hypothetical protein